MEVAGGAEEGFVREWAPCSHVLSLIPPRIQNGLFSSELSLTCVDAVPEYIALGTNVGLVYWFDRKKGNIQRLRCENTTSPITFVRIASTVDYMVGAGSAAGQVTVFQVPREHSEEVPEALRPKGAPKVERYTIGDLHSSRITAIEWSKNGMRLFSGDANGVISMTELDFYMHLCKSMEIVNEGHEIVQLSYWGNALLVSSAYRSIVCERDGGKWQVTQIGTKERKSLCALGAVFQYSYARGGEAALYCARPGLRVWRADRGGNVLQTLLFREAISNPLTVAELLNPCKSHVDPPEHSLGPLHVFRDQFLVSHSDRVLYLLDPNTATAVAVVDDLRRILSVSVSKEEIFILEGPRSLVRLAHAPEPVCLATEEPNIMTRSLTTSLQQTVNTIRDITIDTTVHITSALEPLSIFKDDTIAKAEECFELPPIKEIELSGDVLESMINDFKDVSSDDEVRRVGSEEIQRKFKLYSSIIDKNEELIHSRTSRRAGPGSSGGSTPRAATPVRKVEVTATPPRKVEVSYTAPTLMSVSGYGDVPQQNDELIEKQIEEKERILAKMLNLESLSLSSHRDKTDSSNCDAVDSNHRGDSISILEPFQTTLGTMLSINDVSTVKPSNSDVTKKYDENPDWKYDLKTDQKFDVNPDKRYEVNPVTKYDMKTDKKADTKEKVDRNGSGFYIPKVVELPNNWNLDDIELKLDLQNGCKTVRNQVSLDDSLGEWEVI